MKAFLLQLKKEYSSVYNSILDLWTTELLYLESVINHHQTVDYKYYMNFEYREDQCHAGKTSKRKTIYS